MSLTLVEQLKLWTDTSNSMVFFGGAGVSTESGIPDFRSVDGLYHQKYEFPPETILSRTFFKKNTAYFYRFYREKMIYLNAQPNITHTKLAELEQKGTLSCIITQNIDGLHQKAGSNKVLELHGSVHRNYCVNCFKEYGIDKILNTEGIPRCECYGVIKPDVVLYEESLQENIINKAIDAIKQADLLIIGGTSLSVYPAAGFIRYYQGNRLVLINRSETPYDSQANLAIKADLGQVFAALS
ncbi:NAD-dependent protein deacetylase [Anaerocolumna cellulosilytica]|uniref:NAD-dependent protein deacetylase n=1 Tax=Anaerocolumna cellulosilytica TaxID=433286 RepID=A0A6S6R635_9FIRM|nr:NAD-dependent protein deacylase [Anaerocolumna cellulosilytica]MBB5194301.1 NAD-dependent deacetylase [Anaerocolumna cellulosilytica]BCJ94488.1 NAD-dependent protein deacetylase [Anaerocolumna cellulosilytica]